MDVNVDYNKFFTRVFLWMFLGLILTFGTAFYFSTIGLNYFVNVLSTIPYAFIGLVLIELALVFVLSLFINKISSQLAIVLFLVYAFFSGITFTAVLLAFDFSSVIYVFGITSILFIILASIGYTTKTDLSSIGVFLFVGLIGAIIASIINIFLNNSLLDLILTIILIIVFMGLTMFDVQKLKNIAKTASESDDMEKLAIFGALSLYLDFINLFIQLLKLLGRRD